VGFDTPKMQQIPYHIVPAGGLGSPPYLVWRQARSLCRVLDSKLFSCETMGREIVRFELPFSSLKCVVRSTTGPASKVEVETMALASVHACDCSNGFTYVGEISISKTAGIGGAPAKEEPALSNYYVISTKILVDRTWIREMGEDHKEHYRYVPIANVAAALYRKLKEKGTLNPKLVKLPSVDANHELDV
jgi:hypothetical protein